MQIINTAGHDALGDFAPAFADFNDNILFGQVWSSDALTLKQRSIITITALISKGITDQSLSYHLNTAKQNGVTRSEMAALLTHLAFYAGWPNAWAAFRLAKEIYSADEPEQHGGLFGLGEINPFGKYFTGRSWLKSLTPADSPVQIHNVTFEPGCRNNWHIHHATAGGGQILICVDGVGWYQEAGKAATRLAAGDVVCVPAGVKHWHGAARDCWFSHLALACPGEGVVNEWLAPVSDEDYGVLED